MKIKLITFLVMALPLQTFAAFNCVVDVSRVLIYADGSVNILHTGRNNYTYICNLKTERQGVSITTCAMWTSTLQNTQNNAVKAIFYYGGSGSCSTLPLYGATPAPIYIGTVK
jgi:hypothetical protein